MRCPNCGYMWVIIHGTFDGTQHITFKPDGETFTVIDSEPTDFSWDDHDEVECRDCGHQGQAHEFEAAMQSYMEVQHG